MPWCIRARRTKQGDNDEMRERLYEHVSSFRVTIKPLLGLACHAKGEKDRETWCCEICGSF
jgi:hypothetical protein